MALLLVFNATVTVSSVVSPSSRSVGVNVNVAVCTVALSSPVKTSVSRSSSRPSPVTPVPAAVTTKSSFVMASPSGNAAPVLLLRSNTTSALSPAYSLRSNSTVTVAVAAATPSVILSSAEVRPTLRSSSSAMMNENSLSSPRGVTT